MFYVNSISIKLGGEWINRRGTQFLLVFCMQWIHKRELKLKEVVKRGDLYYFTKGKEVWVLRLDKLWGSDQELHGGN